TAGLRETDDPVEAEGVRRARAQVEQADRILLVVDDGQGLQAEDRALLAQYAGHLPITLVANKIDLSGAHAGLHRHAGHDLVRLSAASGAGIDVLVAHLRDSAGLVGAGEDEFIARRRHLDALARTAAALTQGQRRLVQDQAGELLAEELRRAHAAL